MSAEVMEVPLGEVHFDGRIYYLDGTWSGTSAAGMVVYGTLGDDGPPIIMIPDGTSLGPLELSNNEVGAIISYSGPPPRYLAPGPPVADVFWFETFMERVIRHAERRESTQLQSC